MNVFTLDLEFVQAKVRGDEMVLLHNEIHELKYSWSYNDFEGIKLISWYELWIECLHQTLHVSPPHIVKIQKLWYLRNAVYIKLSEQFALFNLSKLIFAKSHYMTS